ncbi:MAG: hypothetical protein JNM57_12775 [Cyclobacteriaceae bacterium]|nr:hypothetical protein [Cyclobacteriaceae bacterium]
MNPKIKLRLSATGLVTLIFFVLLSPKWLFSPAAWIAPALLVRLLLPYKPVKAFCIAYAVVVLSSVFANYKVVPFPLPFFVIMMVITSVLAALPYLINTVLWKRISGFKKTLVLPAAMVVFEYLNAFGGGGTWGSMAYTQMDNLAFIQLASVTGLWGITFLIFWFASLVNWVMDENFSWSVIRMPVLSFLLIMGAVLFFGAMRTNPYFDSPREVVRIAGVTALNLDPIREMYRDAFGKDISIDVESLTQTSPELAELNRGFAAFIEDPFHPRFKHARMAMESFQDSLLSISEREAKAGAQIITWSEALVFTIKADEERLIDKGKKLARDNKVYFLLTMGSLLPGKVEAGKKFIENKAILINPEGVIENVFFKNKPVPVVEPSITGNGKIPVIHTPYGLLSTSICYDADFPTLIQQTGKLGTDILLLPSGDWKEISPYHGNMARMRAIENGFSMFRMVSNATSLASDHHGRILARKNFFDAGTKVMVADVPTAGVFTLYKKIGDAFVFIAAAGLVLLLATSFRTRSIGNG